MPRAAAASETHVAQATLEALRRGNAADAVVIGVLVAAAASPVVLLGPVQMLAGGAGTGLVAIDGRVRQPGLGAPRPRGFRSDEPIPEAAYVGAPAMPAALATALGSLGTLVMPRALGPAISWAKANAPERVGVLDALGKAGPLALSSDPWATELMAVGGRAVGGLLTREDLASVRPAVERRSERSLGPSGILEVSWPQEEAPPNPHVQIVAACDAQGRVAIACYETPLEALPIPALGLGAPRHAAPVMRGKRRVSPGLPRFSPAPIALRLHAGVVEAAAGIARGGVTPGAVASLLQALEQTIALGDVLARVPAGSPVVLAGLRGSTRAQSRARSTP